MILSADSGESSNPGGKGRSESTVLSYQQMLAVMSNEQVANMQNLNKDFKAFCDELDAKESAPSSTRAGTSSGGRPETDLGSIAGSSSEATTVKLQYLAFFGLSVTPSLLRLIWKPFAFIIK